MNTEDCFEKCLSSLLTKENLLNCQFTKTELEFLLLSFINAKLHCSPLNAMILHAIMSCPLVCSVEITANGETKRYRSEAMLLREFFLDYQQKSLIDAFPNIHFPRVKPEATPEIAKRIGIRTSKISSENDSIVIQYYKGSHYNCDCPHSESNWNTSASLLIKDIKNALLKNGLKDTFTFELHF